MAWRRKAPSETLRSPEPVLGNVYEWILSLPWVVERPDGVGAPGVRTFAVDGEPLDLRQLWLNTGLRGTRREPVRSARGCDRARRGSPRISRRLASPQRSRRCPPDAS